MNIKETSAYLRISIPTLYRMKRKGILVPTKTKGKQDVSYTQEKLDEFLRKGEEHERRLQASRTKVLRDM